MIEGISPVAQALLGTLLTWGLTALGAAMAFFIKGNQVSHFYVKSIYWCKSCFHEIFIQVFCQIECCHGNFKKSDVRACDICSSNISGKVMFNMVQGLFLDDNSFFFFVDF